MTAGRRNLVLHFLLALALFPTAANAEETPAAPTPVRPLTPLARAQARYLVLCLDGVGYDLVEEMRRNGELRHFHRPAPLIAPFPALTNLGMVEMLGPLGAPPARGYEDYYFGPASNRMQGGFLHRLQRKTFIEGSYRAVFHYHPNPMTMTLEYGVPVLGPWVAGRLTLARIRQEFLKSREPVFLAYIDSTDPAAHLGGRWTLRDLLRRVDHLAQELQRHAPVPVEVVVFSDHGNLFTTWQKTNVAEAVEQAGFRVEGKLASERSVVIPQYGLIGAAVLYTRPGQEAAVAEALLAATGTELVAFRVADSVEVWGEKGRARIDRRGTAFRYQSQAGDPLELLPLAADLRARGRADAEGFIHEDDWFEATADHIYPDALRRLWFAFERLVEQPASVIVSLKDGYYTGSDLLDLLSGFQLRATHGNLRRAQSLGFAMSTTGTLLAPESGARSAPEGARPPRALPARHLWDRLSGQRERAWARLRLPLRRCLTLEGGPHSAPALPAP